MVISSSGILIDTLRQQELLTSAQFAQLPTLTYGRCGDARALAKSLIQRGWLSVYQINQLLGGQTHDLVIGPYVVLDRLGQGGLSTVFKAKHREHGNLVAIKVVRPDFFASPEGRQQFLLEVEAMARLDHENVVQFCDADQWKETFYFAMEYVEGTDLGKVVRLSGALPIAEACSYIRQAALGLQHAYERNLIHRDIKPANLYLTHVEFDTRRTASKLFATRVDDPVSSSKTTVHVRSRIKILDWGLASLRTPNSVNQETNTGIVGTADYLAPEQARNAESADIRSDIYSLGCSLYYLLTGQPPFPDGALMQKIMQHQHAEPTPIDTFRTDVPEGVLSIVKRMMAKQPEERFQAPVSAALALAPFTRCVPPVTKRPPIRLNPAKAASDDTACPPTQAP